MLKTTSIKNIKKSFHSWQYSIIKINLRSDFGNTDRFSHDFNTVQNLQHKRNLVYDIRLNAVGIQSVRR